MLSRTASLIHPKNPFITLIINFNLSSSSRHQQFAMQ
jgi:hypothetical protein